MKPWIMLAMIGWVTLIFGVADHAHAWQISTETATKWRTGDELEFHLRQPISVTFSAVPLRSRLVTLGQQQRVGIFVDRRLDPNLPITLAARDLTLEQLLWQIATKQQIGVCRLNDFYYFGPLETAASLPILWQQLTTETMTHKRNHAIDWSQRLPFVLPELTVPGEYLSEMGQRNRFEFMGDPLPHDLWSAIELPSMTLDQQVALIGVGFGNWMQRSADGKQIRWIAFPKEASGKIAFKEIEGARKLLPELRQKFPDAKLSATERMLTVSGTAAELTAIRAVLVAKQRPRAVSSNDQRRYTLTTRASRGSILASVAQQLEKKLDFDPTDAELLQAEIQLSVKEVTLETLLEQTLDGSGLTYEIDSDRLRIMKSK